MSSLRNISQAIKVHYNEERIAFAARTAPTHMEVWGATMPQIKEVLAAFIPEAKKMQISDATVLLQQLVDGNNFELQIFAYCWLDKDRKLLKSLTRNQLIGLETVMDNWVSTDYYGTLVLGPAWYHGAVDIEYILSLSEDQNFWRRRLALCALIGWDRARGKKGIDNPYFLDICSTFIRDPEYKIIQALSWALRFHISRNRDEVETFVKTHASELNNKVLREVHNKLDTGLKH